MSQLKKRIKETRSLPTVLSAEVSSRPSFGVLIYKFNTEYKELWAFPWSYFLGAQYLSGSPVLDDEDDDFPDSENDGLEQIQLNFTRHIVTVRGRYLEQLMGAIVSLQLHVLRELHKDFLEIETGQQTPAPVIIDIGLDIL